jgi:hypothetical protein
MEKEKEKDIEKEKEMEKKVGWGKCSLYCRDGSYCPGEGPLSH